MGWPGPVQRTVRARGARVLERCDISRSIYGISSSPRGAQNIEKCDISRLIYGISNTPSQGRKIRTGKKIHGLLAPGK